ncbi:MAG: IPT/TIG domain-containing protein [Planctomycetes bacterium]|nr:IPT/TIG domain-containing protein [Planctomycetota bacterium]
MAILFLLAAGGLSAQAPVITNISPTSGPSAGGQSVTITGTNMTGATSVTFDGNAATITGNTGTTIDVTTPAGTAGAIDVVVTTPGGSDTSTGGYTYVDAPAITNISPSSGPSVGGQSVTITGTNLGSATSVTVDGNAATITGNTANTVDITTPAGTAGAVNVVVTTAGGSDTSTGGYTYVDAPAITNISPTSGPAAGGTSVTITGTNLSSATSVTFDGNAATITGNTATTVDVTTPAGSAGAVDVVVTTAGGSDTSTGGFTYLSGPAITNISPTSGPAAGGTSVTITGTNLTGATSVTFDGNAATITGNTATTIDVTTPAGSAGAVDVVVTTPGGSDTSTGGFTYIGAPAITNISPSAGPTAGGQSVTITGTSLTGATSVTFDGNAATITGNTATTIDVTTPAGTAGAIDVVVTTPGGSDTSTGGYTYAAAPAITNINPTMGTTAGGTSVTITGTNLSGATSVTFDGNAATITGNTATTVDVTTPAGTAGAVDVVVTTPGGSDTSTGGFTYQTPANPAPTFTVTAGGNGVTSGGTVNVLTGTTVTAANIAIQVDDSSTGDSLTLTAGITNQGTTGIVISEWQGSSTSPTPINANPSTGTFNAVTTLAVTLTANDGVNTAVVFTFDIVVSNAPTITVSAPNGGENFVVGGNMTITWSSSGVAGTVDILLSTNSGGAYSVTLVSGTANDGTETITVPNNPATTCRVRVRDSAAPTTTLDDSDADFTIAVPAPAAGTMSASGNPGTQNALPGSTRTALGFRISETGGSSTLTITGATVRITMANNSGGVAESAVSSITLRRGGTTLASLTSAGWSSTSTVITCNFTGFSEDITASSSADFNVLISFAGTAAPSPSPQYFAEIQTSDVSSASTISGTTVTGGTITLINSLPDDPLDEDKTDDSCDLAIQGGPAWPLLLAGLFVLMLALRRRRKVS